MIEHLSNTYVANYVAMMRAHIDGALLLAEAIEDAKFYEHCKHSEAKIVSVHSPGKVEFVLDNLDLMGIQGVVAVTNNWNGIDRHSHANLLRPSLGDVASILIASDALNRALSETCGSNWLVASEKQVGPVLNRTIRVARVFDIIRVSQQSENPQTSKIQDPLQFVCWNTFELNWNTIESSLLTDSSIQKIHKTWKDPLSADIRDDIKNCDGRDAIALLAAATKNFRPRGIPANKAISYSDLTSLLRTAFELRELENDEIFWQMKRWQYLNPNYRLLGSWRELDNSGTVLDQRYWKADLEHMLRFLAPEETITAFKMDLDNFKKVNEVLSHSVGDEAIQLYCSIVKELLSPVGEVYRRGGDEIVAFASGLSLDRAKELGEKVRAEVEIRFKQWAIGKQLDISPTASIGVVVAKAAAFSVIDESMNRAQKQAKDEGKNKVVFVELDQLLH